MADLNLINQNLKKIKDAGLPFSEAERYLAKEGVTPEQVKEFNLQNKPTIKPQQTGLTGDERSLAYAEQALKGVTFGLGGVISPAIRASISGLFPEGKSFKERYADERKEFKTRQQKLRQESPFLSTGAEIGGGLLTGGVAMKGLGFLAKPVVSVLSKTPALARILTSPVSQAVGTGAGFGGAYAGGTELAEGEPSRIPSSVLTGALLGLATGGALTGVGKGLGFAGKSILGRKPIAEITKKIEPALIEKSIAEKTPLIEMGTDEITQIAQRAKLISPEARKLLVEKAEKSLELQPQKLGERLNKVFGEKTPLQNLDEIQAKHQAEAKPLWDIATAHGDIAGKQKINNTILVRNKIVEDIKKNINKELEFKPKYSSEVFIDADGQFTEEIITNPKAKIRYFDIDTENKGSYMINEVTSLSDDYREYEFKKGQKKYDIYEEGASEPTETVDTLEEVKDYIGEENLKAGINIDKDEISYRFGHLVDEVEKKLPDDIVIIDKTPSEYGSYYITYGKIPKNKNGKMYDPESGQLLTKKIDTTGKKYFVDATGEEIDLNYLPEEQRKISIRTHEPSIFREKEFGELYDYINVGENANIEKYNNALSKFEQQMHQLSDLQPDKKLTSLTQDPYIKDYITKARNSALGRGLKDLPDTDIRVLQATKEFIDDDINKLFKAGENKQGSALLKVKNELVDSVDNAVASIEGVPKEKSSYYLARKASADRFALENAQETAKNIFTRKNRPEDIKRIVDEFSNAEKDAFLVQVKDELLSKIEQAAKTGKRNVAEAVFGAGDEFQVRKQLEAILDKKGFDDLMQVVNKEAKAGKGFTTLLGGSQTAEKETLKIPTTLKSFLTGSQKVLQGKKQTKLAELLSNPDLLEQELSKLNAKQKSNFLINLLKTQPTKSISQIIGTRIGE